MATGDAAPWETRKTKGEGIEEGGTRYTGRRRRRRHSSDEKITGNGNSADEARRQRSWQKYGEDEAMAPLLAEAGVARVGS